MENDEFLDIPQEYKELVLQLAKITNRGEKWINLKFSAHRAMLIHDAHHGYCLEEAMWSIKDDIKTNEELQKS